jgi:hypothetical protein
MKSKMILVCKTNGENCDETGYEVKVGDKIHIICCKKGFEKTLGEFLTYEEIKERVYTDNGERD